MQFVPDDVPQNDFLQAKTAIFGVVSGESLGAGKHISRRSERQESREIWGIELSRKVAGLSIESLYLESQRFA